MAALPADAAMPGPAYPVSFTAYRYTCAPEMGFCPPCTRPVSAAAPPVEPDPGPVGPGPGPVEVRVGPPAQPAKTSAHPASTHDVRAIALQPRTARRAVSCEAVLEGTILGSNVFIGILQCSQDRSGAIA